MTAAKEAEANTNRELFLYLPHIDIKRTFGERERKEEANKTR